MSVQNRATLKSFFETGDKPTQSNFEDLIDSSMLTIDAVQIDAGAITANYALPFNQRVYITCMIGAALNFTLDATDAKLLQAILVKATGAIEPGFASEFKLVSGVWSTSVANYIRFLYISSSEVHYEIYQL